MAICVFPFSYCLSLGISSQTVLHLLGIFSVFVIFFTHVLLLYQLLYCICTAVPCRSLFFLNKTVEDIRFCLYESLSVFDYTLFCVTFGWPTVQKHDIIHKASSTRI